MSGSDGSPGPQRLLGVALAWMVLGLGAGCGPAAAGTVRVAAAANLVPALGELIPRFEAASGHRVVLASGATGALTTQIAQGAPFDVLLAADLERPRWLQEKGLVTREGVRTYAVGRLVLWSARPAFVAGPETLDRPELRHLAVANPRTAPYGAAALEVLRRLGRLERLQPRLVEGASVGQAYAFVATGAAEAGFVALSQLVGEEEGSRWLVPASLHPPIEQGAALLAAAADPAAAEAFLDFLGGPVGRQILERHGYEVP